MCIRDRDKDTTFDEYTTIELLSVAMLIVISTFALDFIHSDRSIFKTVDPVSYTHLDVYKRQVYPRRNLRSWLESAVNI